MNKPVELGERIVVHGIHYATAHVIDVFWLPTESRWIILLDWGEHGKSRVYDSDENLTWYRYAGAN